MLNDNSINKILEAAMSKTADFAEVFIEQSESSSISLLNGRVHRAGKGIASGYRLYNDFVSQHMPVSYYISALFYLPGCHAHPPQSAPVWSWHAQSGTPPWQMQPRRCAELQGPHQNCK